MISILVILAKEQSNTKKKMRSDKEGFAMTCIFYIFFTT